MTERPGIFRRLLSLAPLVWALGFIAFALILPQPAGDLHTDGVIVLTGGGGRIPRGIDVLRRGWARQMLVAGVDREVRPREFAAEYGVEPRLFACCMTLGYESVDTRSNALEAARWIASQHLASVRLVTTDWHMRRAAADLAHAAPAGTAILRDAVPSKPSMRILFLEYNKYIARWVARIAGY
ncbi:YdcF family protein [Novosphingobium lentum]|uniref:YdcF family protein n=1 Tax=Novosphingobium lentum TaxID=145287 RepID=UPI0008361A9B|nr:YdcF family protein [Novosphingobium lentum]